MDNVQNGCCKFFSINKNDISIFESMTGLFFFIFLLLFNLKFKRVKNFFITFKNETIPVGIIVMKRKREKYFG